MNNEDLEYYFIQLLFHNNRMLLSYKNKDLYKVLLNSYCNIYKQLPNDIPKIDILNSNFLNMINLKKWGGKHEL